MHRIMSGTPADTGVEIAFPIGNDRYAPVNLVFQGMMKGQRNLSCWIGNSSDSLPPLGFDQYHYCRDDWHMSIDQPSGGSPYVATFDLSSTNNTGDSSKYIVMK